MVNIFKQRQIQAPTVIIFVWLFLPMLITFNSHQSIIQSGTPVTEKKVEPPVDDYVDQFFTNTSRFRQIIERPNYINYAHAILPVHDATVSSDFGWRVAPCKGCSSDHQGVDFVPGAGEPVMAVLDGIVTAAGRNQGYGFWVKIEHVVPVSATRVERWQTIYAHLQANSIPTGVRVGSLVQKGQVIGLVGSTGISTGPHLHFELHIDGKVVDPLPVLAQSQAVVDLETIWR